LAGPLTGQPKLVPRSKILFRPAGGGGGPLGANPAAGASFPVNAVDLIEREAGERILPVHDEHEAGSRALRVVVGAAGKPNLQRRVPELALERHAAVAPLAVAHQPDVRLPRHKPGESLRGVDEI